MSSALSVKASRFTIVAALFALWELLSRTGMVNPRLLPSASDTIATLVDLLGRPGVRSDILVTGAEVLTAFVIAVPIGALIGILIAEKRYFAE